jgi:1,4-dihydroxy-2-naphthoate octaprenyltransferase
MQHMLKHWLSAFRLRTLPLAISGIICGSMVAEHLQNYNAGIMIWAIITAVFLQILSNLANDYGDFVKGTDNENRIGNKRAMQSGVITKSAMQKMIGVFVLLSLLSGIRLLYIAFPSGVSLSFIAFFIIGLLAILAAIYYTVGKHAYGYSGKGDIAVFIFFGIVSVLGVYLLHTQMDFHLDEDGFAFLPAIAIGMLSTAVLNTNNIRDIENDKSSGKITLAVKWGIQHTKQYHVFLVIGGVATMCTYTLISYGWIGFIPLVASIPILKQMRDVVKNEPGPLYNQYLKNLSLGVLLLTFSLMLCNLYESIAILNL